MLIERPVRTGANATHRFDFLSWLRRLRPLQSRWALALAALAVLTLSQALWLWNAWPARELLDRDQFGVGLSGMAI